MFAAPNTYKVLFFDYISYFVKNDDFLAEYNEAKFHIKIKVGDIVEIKENSNSDNKSFAMVKAIVTHRANDGKVYAFFIFSWFEDLKRTHPILQYAQFQLRRDNFQQQCIFAISIVDY
ncbi:21498_t:CDS:1 [Racocetra persica]|uniref:21498_t:CDS:1 n=1 Tax=Racocetra persica TaxID=160502 RepID=A0ACA9NTQ7_9GLOM|nr:21498_t:CDS:1 [Racocetra persica]